MDPVFLQIGSFTIAWYGVLITLGIVAGVWVGTKMARERGLDVDLFNDMILWMIIWGLVGARIVFVATSWNQFENTPFPRVLLDIVNLRQGGISIHGGLIGGILVMLYYARRKGMDFYRYADLCVPGVAFGIIGGRIGNIMNGTDTVGRVTGWPVGYRWPDSARAFHDGMCVRNPNPDLDLSQYCQQIGGQMVMTAPVHFAQLYGVIIGVILSVAAYFWLRSRIPGWAFWQFWLWYSVLRAGWEETFRLNPLSPRAYLNQGLDAPGIGLFTDTHVISIPLILVSIWMLVRLRRRGAPAAAPADTTLKPS
ncbi:prolipoprotein diacylglyceryl transferase [Deinococcus indicus]|jgi:phosphatidylglycerol---prolipoprotein diacylglyceryl transferase|uniref:Phosphatidylglycerol--prolipoprotein diacylglyceryl transferase n=1 Tax=Deinococcus indicus TaxID=223556 RepID=A0A2D0A842_9DEIO|nr:prolipoprotein diacylglyceryl transferase [Deinococcus indicus]OWL96583.1 prolipoprotein diacylglyceryl transferase [Deinococcus indicus]GHG34127.1 prolipoprotein diacylglyceryl transferase [Deinococcus indicus]